MAKAPKNDTKGTTDGSTELSFLQQGLTSLNLSGRQDFSNAPLLTRDAFVGSTGGQFPYKSLLGSVLEQHVGESVPLVPGESSIVVPAPHEHSLMPVPFPSVSTLYLNVSEPFSTVICGVQVSSDGLSSNLSLTDILVAGVWEEPFSLYDTRIYLPQSSSRRKPSGSARWTRVSSIHSPLSR